jgi:hypothetical protein
MTAPPDWINELPAQIGGWLASVRDPARFGLFKDCVDSKIPHAFPASLVGLSRWMKLQSCKLEEVPGYSPAAYRATVKSIQGCQQPATGLIIEPQLDARFPDKQEARAYLTFRKAVTRYTLDLLAALKAQPLYPYAETGTHGRPDPVEYLRYMKTGNWNEPWGIGSHAAGQTRELFYLIDAGHTEYIPAVCEGIAFILAQQNPVTGMWGPSSTPLYQQISGALKVIGRFLFYLGIELPHMDKLADSCIRHHADGGFYADGDDMCFPRNVAEMCIACLESSDYRREELLATLTSIAEMIRQYQMPDGAFASDRTGCGRIQWCGAEICGSPTQPRSNMNGTQGALWAFGLIGPYLGWTNLPFENPQAGWRERVARLKYRIVLTPGGKVAIVQR